MQRESDEYNQLGKISWLWIPIQTIWIPLHLVLIMHHTLTTVKGSIVCIWVLMSFVMIATFPFKILHNLLSRYTLGPGPRGIAWQHPLEFSRPILRHTPRCSKNELLILKKSKKKKKWKMRCSGGNETTTRQLKLKHQESE